MHEEVHSKLIEKFASGQELTAYMESEAGKRLLEWTPPAIDMPSRGIPAAAGRIIWSLMTGLILVPAGTGMGFALFDRGYPAPHLELSQHPVRKGMTYDQWIGNAALQKLGAKSWNRRVRKAIGIIATLVTYDTLAIGGGNAKRLDFKLPLGVRTVSNEAGITGGIRLWDSLLDPLFVAEDAMALPVR